MNGMTTETFNLVTVILAVGSLLQPLFFGAIFLFMFKLFPTRREIEMQEENQKARHLENQSRFTTIEGDIKTLLER